MVAPTVLASRMLVRTRVRHLHVFLKIAELGSINRAANAVGLTQPSTTHVLADLEAMLECRLFERHARGMKATPTALALLPFARRFLDTVNEWAEVTATLSSKASSVVQIAAISGAVTGLLAQHLPAFAKTHPDILVQVQEGDIEQINGWMSTGVIDLVLCREPAVVPEGWAFEALLSDEFVVVAGRRHPLAKRRGLKWDELWGWTWLQGPIASAPRRVFERLASEAGAQPNMRLVSVRSMALIWAILRSDQVLMLTPLSFVSQLLDAGQLSRIDISVSVPFEPIGLMAPRSGCGDGAETFASFIRHECKNTRTSSDSPVVQRTHAGITRSVT